MILPDSAIGVAAFGIKTGIITADDAIIDVLHAAITKNPDLIAENDILCITEAVVAITQHNTVTLDAAALAIREKLGVNKDAVIGIIHPILSRNRFSMILQAIARAVPKGKVCIQLAFPSDEQGNPLVNRETLHALHKTPADTISLDELHNRRLLHPETGMDYITLYEETVQKEGAGVEIFLANDPARMTEKHPDGIIICSVHNRTALLDDVQQTGYTNAITLQDICSDPAKEAHSEYGLLGSNVLDPAAEELKLCPKNADAVCKKVQSMIQEHFRKHVEVLIYGDGAYKDPESGIYELADPVSCFGCTAGIKDRNRIGVKTKYLMQKLYNEGRSREEIQAIIKKEHDAFISNDQQSGFSAQGTTPRKIENLVASLADLISGSADANTPIVVVRNFV